MISNSGSDERGQYYGGAAGDQTGTEWRIQPWYSRPWTCVLRHPNAQVRAKIAELARKAANNNAIGYDQWQRSTYWTQLQAVGYDPSKITTPCEADCSAGVIANVRATGYLLGISQLANINASYTANMRSGFAAAGFQVLTESKYLTSDAYLVVGDILLYDGVHTATNLDNGSKAGGDSTPVTEDFKAKGTATSTEDNVNVRATPGGAILRQVNKGNRFEVDGKTAEGWVHVRVAGLVGWIYGQYVKYDGAQPSPAPAPKPTPAPTPAPSKSWKAIGTATCTDNGVNVRATPGGNIIRQLNFGNRFEVDGQKSGDWVHIKVVNDIGWIHKNYVKYDNGQSTSTPTSTKQLNRIVQWNGVVIADSLNVRKWAGTEYGTCSFSPLKGGSIVGVCDSVKASDGSTWYYIMYNGKYGFVHSGWINRSR